MTVTDEARQRAREAIGEERERQVRVEGWTAAHDDGHRRGELLLAALIYLHCDPADPSSTPMNGDVPMGWPWDADWWKPKDRRANLVRAGALCIAEYDRLVRKDAPSTMHVERKLELAIEKLAALEAK